MLSTLILSTLLPHAPATARGSVKLASGRNAGNAVVWLDGAEKSAPLKSAMIDQKNRTFIPHISVVTVNTEINFPNHDTVFHNVFAAFDAKKFDLGMYPRGKTKIQKFSRPGLVALMCSIHSEMSAFVMVVDTPYYTVADRSGNFNISGIAPGSYKLRSWHESGEKSSEDVSISGDKTFAIKSSRK